MLERLKKSFFPRRNVFCGLDIFRGADGTLLLFPSISLRGGGPMCILPELTALVPPYEHEAVGQAVLRLWEAWKDAEPLESPPEKKFWTTVPKCRSYRSFQRSHQYIAAEIEGRELSMAYEPRDERGGYSARKGDVELCASFDLSMPQLTHRMGRAVWEIFRLAEELDPLPPPASEARK